LSNVLNGSQSATEIFMNPLSWYHDNGIQLHAGVRATHIDRERRVVVGAPLHRQALAYSVDARNEEGAAEIREPYDYVIIATGSRPFVPPMDGFAGEGAFMFRTIDDCARIADFAKDSRRAAVGHGFAATRFSLLRKP
jgi:nitrite reductase (NADH) large subunit